MHTFERFGDSISRNVSLARYTAARLGGKAEWLYHARNDESEMIEVVQEAWRNGLDVRILGKGANVLISPKGVKGLAVINEINVIECIDISKEHALLRASAGVPLGYLARFAQRKGIGGLDWLATVPGTVGGAVVNNAGAYGGEIATILLETEILTRKLGRRKYRVHDMDYAYRYSRWKASIDKDFVVLTATFGLTRDDPNHIASRTRNFQSARKETQPPGASLGSIFKNPAGDFAGRIVEAAGLKGLRVGAVEVSHKHANFFINHGTEANAADYDRLIRKVQCSVFEHSSIHLELEIEYMGEW